MRNFFTTAAFLLAIGIIYSAGAQTVTVYGADCARFTSHVLSSDVAYKPGVDVHGKGNKLAPADLGGGVTITAPRSFEIPITMDLQKRLSIPVSSSQYQPQNFTVGVVKWENGRATFNGEPLQNEEAARLSALCQKQMAVGN